MPNFGGGLSIISKEKSTLSPDDSNILSKGFTPKSMMQDQQNHSYIAKSPDPLKVKDVFTGYLPDTQISESDPKLKAHIFSLEFEGAFLEVLAPIMMKALFGDLLVVPELFLHVTENNEVLVLSKLLHGFDEFLHRKSLQKFGPLLEREMLPKREQFDLSKDEAYFIGQLYAAALIFNHWDILNSKLLNSGVVRSNGLTKAAIVDFGFIGHLSYKGRHNDSLSVNDENFVHGKKIDYRFFTDNYLKSYRHRFSLPFDGTVGSLLPHTIIEDLFDMSGQDPISTMMRKGFAAMVEQASQTIDSDPKLYEKVWQNCLARISTDSTVQPKDLGKLMNMSYYSGELGKDNFYTIILDRVHDCRRLVEQLNHGADMLSLHEQSRDKYVTRNSF